MYHMTRVKVEQTESELSHHPANLTGRCKATGSIRRQVECHTQCMPPEWYRHRATSIRASHRRKLTLQSRLLDLYQARHHTPR